MKCYMYFDWTPKDQIAAGGQAFKIKHAFPCERRREAHKKRSGYRKVGRPTSLKARLRKIRVPYEVSESGCWLWLGAKTSQGYGGLSFNGKYIPAHKLIYAAHKGKLSVWTKTHLHHICENRTCVNPDHLQLLTISEHKRAHGASNCKGSLSWEVVGEIRSLRATGLYTMATLSSMFSVATSTICDIVNNKSWREDDRKRNCLTAVE